MSTLISDYEGDEQFLSIHELDLLYSHKLNEATLDIVRDLFVASCLTGMCFQQLMMLSPKHVYADSSNRIWLLNPCPQPFNYYEEVPFIDLVHNITSKYEHHEYRNHGFIFPSMDMEQIEDNLNL